MKDFIKNTLENNSVDQNKLTEFIVYYCNLCGVKEPSADEIRVIFQLISNGMFDLRYALKQAANKLNLNVIETYDKNKQLIKTQVYE